MRTDNEIFRDIMIALRRELPYSCESIDLAVERGWVTLHGLEWDYQCDRVQHVMKGIHGVAAMRMEREPRIEPTRIVQSLRDALRRSPAGEADPLRPSNSTPTVQGAVREWAQRAKVSQSP